MRCRNQANFCTWPPSLLILIISWDSVYPKKGLPSVNTGVYFITLVHVCFLVGMFLREKPPVSMPHWACQKPTQNLLPIPALTSVYPKPHLHQCPSSADGRHLPLRDENCHSSLTPFTPQLLKSTQILFRPNLGS